MDGARVCVWIYVLSAVLGIGAGLLRAYFLKKNFPEFFSPFLSNTDRDFADISKNIKPVNFILDEDLTYERFTQSRKFQ